ncbi:MAG: hypothetical protein EBY15_04935 [Gammaproteobacteria bacterium]|nr:hypothetical protein [Gammaproteobacteria bacterium]
MLKMLKKFMFALSLMAPCALMAETPKALVGQWKLTQIESNGKTMNCPGQFPMPPGTPAIVAQFAKCADNEILTITLKNGKRTYHHNLGVLGSSKSPDGYWYSHQILNVGNYINFVDAALPDDPRSYLFNQSKDKKTLTISDTMEVYDPTTGGLRPSHSALVFVRVGQ